jgi:hypothetical protein
MIPLMSSPGNPNMTGTPHGSSTSTRTSEVFRRISLYICLSRCGWECCGPL